MAQRLRALPALLENPSLLRVISSKFRSLVLLLFDWLGFLLVCLFVVFCFVLFWDRILFCSPGCPGTHYVVQDDLELRNLLASVSPMLELKASATMAFLTNSVHFGKVIFQFTMFFWIDKFTVPSLNSLTITFLKVPLLNCCPKEHGPSCPELEAPTQKKSLHSSSTNTDQAV